MEPEPKPPLDPAEPPEAAPAPAPAAAAPAKAAKPKVSIRQRLRSWGAWIREHYLVVDPRTLGVLRIVLGFLLTADCIRHWSVAHLFYSNSGVLTNHYHLFRPSSGYNFSLYHAFSSLPEVHVAFALSTLVYFLFCIGYKTRLFSILSLVLVTSMDNRLVMVENGGYVVVNLITCWAMFMPTDRRFSVDAMIRSYRERKERTAADLNERYRPPWMVDRYVSLIVLLAVVNLAAIYFFNVVNKSGQVWKKGETVHYVLHLDRMVTGLAVWLREHLPFRVTQVLTWAVLAHEALLLTTILSPTGRRYTRTFAILGIWALHFGFGVMMRLGPFSWFMMAWGLILLTPVQWDMLEAWYRKRAEPRVVVYDRGSPLGFALCRLLARLDSLELLRFEESESAGGDLLVVRDLTRVQSHTGRAAAREMLQALPGGRFLRPAALLLGPLLGWMGRRRDGVARFFGLTIPPRGAERRPVTSPLGAKLGFARATVRELLVAWLFVGAISQAIKENKSIPAVIREHKQPKAMEATIQYPRIFQGWGMFAPNPITDDGSLTVEAWTVDGRRIDPFTGEEPDLDLTDARGLGLGQITQDYFNRIRFDRNKVFRTPLKDFLLRWHLETGRPEDELVAFDVYWVRDQCPKPGHLKAYKNEKIAILTWRKPGYTPPPGHPPIPPPPKEESAGN